MNEQLEQIAKGIESTMQKQATFESDVKSIREESMQIKKDFDAAISELSKVKEENAKMSEKMSKMSRFSNSGSAESDNVFSKDEESALKEFVFAALEAKSTNQAKLKSKIDLEGSDLLTSAYRKITKGFRTDIGINGGNMVLPREILPPMMIDNYKLTYAPMLSLCNRVVSKTSGVTIPVTSFSAIVDANLEPRPEVTDAKEANTLQTGTRDISTYEMSAFFNISTKMLTQLSEGSIGVDLLAQQLVMLEKVKEMKKNKLILNGKGQYEANGIITEAKKSGGRISKIQTRTSNAIDLDDLLAAVTDADNFVDYYINPNFAILVDKATFGYITRARSSADEHYLFNNMTVHIEGIGSNSIFIKVGTYTIRVMSADHNAGLDSFIEGGSNANKIVAVIGDFKNGYTYLDSTQNLYLDGTTLVTAHMAGQIPFYNSTYFGGDIVDNRALKVLQIKA